MKLKTLVTFSSLFVLAILVICASVYAYNAYCTASESACRATASVNNFGLVEGSYTVSARVDQVVRGDHDSFADGEPISLSAIAKVPAGEDCVEGSAYASVSGFDAQDRPHHTDDSASF